VTGTAFTAGSAVLAEAELELLDGLTAGTAIASKVVTTDSSIDTTGQRNLTISGELDAATLDISGNADIDGTTNLDIVDIDGAVQIDGTVTVGVDDIGLDVKMFGASAGAYALWDESANLLDLRGATAAGPGHLKLTTGELTVVDADVLGKIEFQAPLESDSNDAILVGAAIWAEADDTFAAGVNNTDLVFALGKSEAAAEKFRFTADTEIGIAGANYGTDGQVLTSGGAGAAVAWEDASAGSVTAINNATQSELVTIGSTTTELDAEANLTFTGSALTCIATITTGVDGTGHDVKFFGDTAGSFLLWDESDDALELTDSSPLKIGDGADMQIYHDGTDSFVTNATGALKLATETSGIVVTIGHTTSETTVADNLTITGTTTGTTFDTNGTADAIILDANGNTTISSPSDDQIDFEIAGADDFTMTANAFNVLTGSHATFADSANAKFGTGNDMLMYHDGSNSYITNAVGALKIATETSGIALTIGHTTSETTIADNLTVTGTLTGTLATAAQGSVTSLGTLTTLTVDNIITNGTTIGHTDDTDLITLADGAVTVAGTIGSGAITSTGIVTGTAFTAGSAVLAEAELELLDGLTAGTAIASKVVTTDSSIDTTGQRNLTISGELDAATLDISGNADIDGTMEADAYTIGGASFIKVEGTNFTDSLLVGHSTTGTLSSASRNTIVGIDAGDA